MATMEKLMRAFESLKAFQQQGPPTAEELVQKQNSPEFQKLLGIAMEMFLLCSDDGESDVRMVADECLNKIIKALMDSNLPRLQLELYKEIKKVYFDPRCLMVPVEEEHPTALILGVLLTLRYLMPLLQQQVKDTSLKGSFGVTRKEAEVSPTQEQLVQVYELTLHYTQYHDHNVITAALELLQQMFRTPPSDLLHALITAGSMPQVSISREETENRSRSGSILELIGKLLSGEEEGLEDDIGTKSEVSTGTFTGSVNTESGSEIPSSSGVSTLGPADSSGGHDIITEQPRSCQHNLQSADSVELSGASEAVSSTATASTMADGEGTEDEDVLSRSSSQISTSAGPSDPSNLASSPASESSQTTTEGPDSAVTPSDCSELVSVRQRVEGGSQTSTEGPNVSPSSSGDGPDFDMYHTSTSTSSFTSDSEKVLDGSESQYSGMQIGQLQDEEEEGTSHPHEAPLELFSDSTLARSKPHLLESKSHSRQPSDSSVDRLIPKDEALESAELENKPSRIKGEIGHYTDQNAAPLVHCVRLLCASFLLNGQKNGLVPDKEVRVSVKALAVSCVGAAAALHPEAFFNKLYRAPLEGIEPEEQQYISDILKYIDHGDPQIRGATAILCGTIIYSILNKTRFNVESWLANVKTSTGNHVSLVDCVPLLQKTLKDESSVTCKLACTAVRHCIMTLCSSSFSALGLQLIVDLLTLRNSSYWLVRTELLETLAEMDFRTYRGFNISQNPSDVTVENNLSRVITAVSHALTSSTSRALTVKPLQKQRLTSFRTYRGFSVSQNPSDVTVENNLSRVTTAVSHALTSSTSRALTSGPTDDFQKNCTVGMAHMVLSLLNSAWFPLDLSAHQDALMLAGNLLAAAAPKSLKNPWTAEDEANAGVNKQEEPWPALGDRTVVTMVEQLFSHLMKILNICAHVIDDVAPGPAIKASLPSLSNTPSLSPIRRKGKEKEPIEQNAAPLSPKKITDTSPARPADTAGATATNKSSTLGSFYHLPPYLKLFDVLKATHANYKVTLDLQNNTEKFGGFLRSALDVLSQLLELATLQDIGKCVEEILGYLKSCFCREPTMVTVCVQQLLKTLFGTNLASQYEGSSSNPSKSQGKAQRLGSSNLRLGLYHYCFMAPYTHFTQALADASLRNMVQAEHEQDASGWFDVLQNVSTQLKSSISNVTRHRADKNAIHNHIRLFEPLVIKALKQYTTTTSVYLQRQVLDLLAQLVQLRVNYCLLDSDQPTVLKKTLQCLEGIHLSQSGAVLMLYVDKFINTPFRVLARMVDTLACRRIEMLLAETLQNSIAQLPLEELDRIQQHLQSSGLAQRHQRLYSLLDRFRATVLEDSASPSPPVTSHPLDGETPPTPESVTVDKAGVAFTNLAIKPAFYFYLVSKTDIRKMEFATLNNSVPKPRLLKAQYIFAVILQFCFQSDVDWYVMLVRSQCCTRTDTALLESTELLTKLPQPDLCSIMVSKEFNLNLLAPCLSVGLKRVSGEQGSALFETTLRVTLEQVSSSAQLLPSSHQVFQPLLSPGNTTYWNKLSDVYGEVGLYQTIVSLCRALTQYLLSIPKLPAALHMPSDKEVDATKFVVLALETLSWRLINGQVPLSIDLQTILDCCCLALQHPAIWSLLASAAYVTHACSFVNCIKFLIEAGPIHIKKACETMAELVESLQTVLALGHSRNEIIPAFLTPTLRNITISLARLPLVNSYIRVPPLVWKLGWSPKPGGEFGTAFPEIPVEFLQEKDVFREFLYRVNTLGWTSRTQFEETWASLLGVLVTQPIAMDHEENQHEEDLERTQINVLAVQAITSLVLSAMTIPVAGNPAVSCLEQQPRNKALKALDTR
ncbi:UNVERIFIED_CONTAM: hypothetical protein FKN15_005980 [Acipenser sinensis]